MVIKSRSQRPEWLTRLRPFGEAQRGKAIWQLVNTLVPYALLWVGMIATVASRMAWMWTALLVVPTAGFLVRIFIIFHDCCHGSFFASKHANRFWGYVTGVLTLTPFEDWRHAHLTHHATAGDLDRRGTGDVVTKTVAEYRALSPLKRIGYRLYRNPLVMFGLGPVGIFVLSHRTAPPGATPDARRSVVVTNVVLVGIAAVAALAGGLWIYLVLQLAVSWLAGVLGIWLFYVQHQFETVYWARHDTWDRVRAALEGSSFYRLPRVLQWFSGNIGFHHIHHLRPSVPNYRLQACYEAVPEVRRGAELSLRSSLRCLGLALWDEERGRLVTFRGVRPA